MDKFKNLQELILMKFPNPALTAVEVSITKLNEAHMGFTKCDSLEILSLWNLNLCPTELNQLRKELQKSKPKLAISHHLELNQSQDTTHDWNLMQTI